MAASEYTESAKRIGQPYKIRNSAQAQAGRFFYLSAASTCFFSFAIKRRHQFSACACALIPDRMNAIFKPLITNSLGRQPPAYRNAIPAAVDITGNQCRQTVQESETRLARDGCL